MSHSKEFPFIKLNKKRIYKYNESSNKTKYISYFFKKKIADNLPLKCGKVQTNYLFELPHTVACEFAHNDYDSINLDNFCIIHSIG